MLRAGKEVRMNSVKIKSKDAFIIAPVIDLCGIKIRCDKPTPEKIKQFFATFGADVGRIRYMSELLARVRGNYEIDQAAILKFIKENEDLVSGHNEGSELIPDSTLIKTEVINSFAEKDNPITFMFANKLMSAKLSAGFSTGQDALLTVGSYSMRGQLFAKRNIFLNSGTNQQILPAIKYSDAPIGLLSHMNAQNIQLSSPSIEVQSGIVEAASVLNFNSRNIQLSLEKSIDWVNNPHADTNTLKCTERVKLAG